MNRLTTTAFLATTLMSSVGCGPEANNFSLPDNRLDAPERPLDGIGEPGVLPPSDPTSPTLPASPSEPDVGAEPEAGTPEPDPPPSYCTSLDLIPVPQQTLRLNDVQFANTIRSLFSYGVTLAPTLDSTVVAAETFSTFPGVNEILFEDAEDLIALSEGLAVAAVDNIDALLPCAPADVGELACAETFIATFGERAFRRPLTATEHTAFVTLYDTVRQDPTEPLTFDESIGVVTQAILLSPQLLYLVEQGLPVEDTTDIVALDAWELASRLSYLLWNMPPDDTLRAAAADGSLLDDAVLMAQATRLIDHPSASPAVTGFFAEWFGVSGTFFDDRVSPALAAAFNEEFDRNVEFLFRNGGEVGDLLSFDASFVNASLATHYGITPNPSGGDDDWQQVALPAERRGGLITTAAFSAATAHASNHTSFVHRGKAVRERLLCGELGIPDPNFLAQNPELPDDATVREKIDARMEVQPCGGCHILMDPIGIGMEDFDEQGLYRATYDNAQPVDAAGEVLFINSLEPGFHGTNELAAKLAPSEVFADCAADQWLRYTVGRRHIDDVQCLIEQLTERQDDLGGDLRALMLAIVTSDAFRYRTLQAEAP